jgi:hypothetical protein
MKLKHLVALVVAFLLGAGSVAFYHRPKANPSLHMDYPQECRVISHLSDAHYVLGEYECGERERHLIRPEVLVYTNRLQVGEKFVGRLYRNGVFGTKFVFADVRVSEDEIWKHLK